MAINRYSRDQIRHVVQSYLLHKGNVANVLACCVWYFPDRTWNTAGFIADVCDKLRNETQYHETLCPVEELTEIILNKLCPDASISQATIPDPV
jgi:hypothetical protein